MIPIKVEPNQGSVNLDGLLIEDEASGDYRLNRRAFTDEKLFELEMKYIFEGNWIFLAHESQIPNNNDYYTTTMGRQPVFIARNRNGELNAFINACPHRGATLCRHHSEASGRFWTSATSSASQAGGTSACAGVPWW